MPPTPAPSPSPALSPGRSVDPNMVPTQPHSHLVDLIGQAAAWVADRPWLAGAAAIAIVVVIVAAITVDAAVRTARHRRLACHAHQVLITPPPEVDPAGAG